MIFCVAACTRPGKESDGTKEPSKTDGSSGDQSKDPDASQTETPTEAVTDEYDAMGLDKNLKFNEDFVIYTWRDQKQWEWVDKDNYDSSDVIKSAIFQRQTLVEEKLGVRIKIKDEPGSWNDRQSFIKLAQASIDNEEHAFDLIGQYTCAAPIGAMSGLYQPLNKTKYFNSDHEWWPGDIVESASINRNLYFVAGDISPTLIRGMGAMILNLDLATKYEFPDVYDMVFNKQWTLEKFKELVVGTNAAGNVDGSQSYSLTFPDNVSFDNLFYAGGFRFVDSDPVSGTLKVSDTLAGQPIVDWYETWQKALWDNDDIAIVPVNAQNGFVAGNSLMHLGNMADVQNYLQKVKDFEFAILPVPMRDEKQDNYKTIVGMWVTYYSIPRDVKNPDMSSAVLEALGYYGMEKLTPTVYEEVFQLRYLESEENARVFDLLHDTLTYDTGRFFADQINVFALFRDAAKSNTKTWTVIYAQKSVWETKIAEIVDKLG